MNILNPALTTRAFLFFAYPATISGDVWVAARRAAEEGVDGFSAATWIDGFTGATWAGLGLQRGPGGPGRADLLGGLRGLGAGLDGRDLGPGLPGRRRAPGDHRGGVLRIMTGVVIGTVAWRPRCSTPRGIADPTRTSRSRSGGTWCSAAGPSAPSTWPPTRSRARTPTPGRWIYGLSIGVLTILVRVGQSGLSGRHDAGRSSS